MRTDTHVEQDPRTGKRNLHRWIGIPGLLLAICVAGMASATTAGLDEAGGATSHASAQLAAADLHDRADVEAPRTNVRVMWFAGLALILYQLYRKQRSLEQQPVA